MTVLENPLALRIVRFLEEIGIAVSVETLNDAFLPGIAVRDGGLVVDPDRLTWPSDLLHEAGHIAVTDPAHRASLCKIADDPAEEMAAIVWSYAAAVHLGIDARTLFHDGYKGGGAALAATFASGGDVGVPLLAYWQLTEGRQDSRTVLERPFPKMLRWLR